MRTIQLSFRLGARTWPRACATGFVFALVATGCADGPVDATESDEPVVEATPQAQAASASTWCEAKQILDKSCAGCHDGKGTAGTPMGLVKHADYLAAAPLSAGKKVYEAVGARMHDVARPMPPRGLLPADQLKKVDAWIAAGAPAGNDPTCTGTTGGTTGGADAGTKPGTPKPGEPPDQEWPPKDCDDVYELRSHAVGSATAPYMVPPGGEFHPQITINPPWGSTKVQAISFKPLTDNAKVLHHWILYNGMAFLTGWAPGDDERQPFPPDVGMDMPSTANSLRLDMHYYNTTGSKSEPDRSGVAVCVVKGAKLRPKPAAVMMGFMSFGPVLAPANKRGHQATSSCTVSGNTPVTLMTASPHAHKYARHMKFSVKKANGQTIVMHDQPFKFGEQGSYPLNPPVVLNKGDVVTTTCVYDNDTSRNITFGESTENEMCFNFASYYPKGALQCGGLGGLFGR